jgi:serine/threonine-protein kinase
LVLVLGVSQKNAWARSLVGRTLGRRYRLERLLGVGGMGAVYEAIHRSMDRRVAVKVLLPTIAEDADFVERFEREARAAATVAGPGVPQLFDLDVDVDEGPFLVMELLEGEGLDQRLEREGSLPPKTAVALVIQLLETLAPVHARGIVHRDLKPANIFLAKAEDGSERIKILDFGIARLLFGPDSVAKLTQPGAAVGTPSYMAPEQLRADPDVDGRADLYSVGIVLYQALSGRLPHPQSSMQALIAAVITGMPVHLASVCPSLPKALVDAVHRALSVVPSERFTDASAMRAALVAIDLDGVERTHAPDQSARRPDPSAPTAPAVGAASTPVTRMTPTSRALTETAPERKGSFVVPALIGGIVVLLMVLGGLAAAVGFLVTSDARDPVTVIAPNPTNPPQPPNPPNPLNPIDQHRPVATRPDLGGWSPPEPLDIADPLPPPMALTRDPELSGRVQQIVLESGRFLDLGRHDEAEVVLQQLGQEQILPGAYEAEVATAAYVRLGDALSHAYREDPRVPAAEVPGTLADLEQRILTAYAHAISIGGPRYALCTLAKQAAFQLVAAHAVATWPPALGAQEGDAISPAAHEIARARADAAIAMLEPVLSEEMVGGAPECRVAAEGVLSSARERP